MKLFLIRHGETTDNVAHVYAGITDSPLTVHGNLQAERLGKAFADQGLRFSHIFSSDLQRAANTANVILASQPQQEAFGAGKALEVQQLIILREKDFGSYEGVSFLTPPRNSTSSGIVHDRSQHHKDADDRDVESSESMDTRMNEFLQKYLLRILQDDADDKTAVAIVSHGVILSHLWRCFLACFSKKSVALSPCASVDPGVTPLEHLGRWSNTGYLELDIQKEHLKPADNSNMLDLPAPSDLSIQPSSLPDIKILIQKINGRDHLKGLKRTGGGVGSSRLDTKQKKIESFFMKP